MQHVPTVLAALLLAHLSNRFVISRLSYSSIVYDMSTGEELFKLVPRDISYRNFFGFSVAIEGNLAIVGAWGDDGAGEFSGAAYLFDVHTGNELAKLTASDAAEGDSFGIDVGISSDKAIVGAYRKNGDGGVTSGAVYVFSTVPEPTSLLLLGICAACLLWRRR